MNLRRTRIEIINDILRSMQDKNGIIKPTHLMYKSNLSHKKMTEYLNELIQKGMIREEITPKGRFYRITEKGIEYIVEFRRIKEFSDSFGL